MFKGKNFNNKNLFRVFLYPKNFKRYTKTHFIGIYKPQKNEKEKHTYLCISKQHYTRTIVIFICYSG